MARNTHRDNGTWTYASSDMPCVHCGKPDQCSLSPDGSRWTCYRPSAGDRTKTGKDGRAYTIHHLATNGHTPRPPIPQPTKSDHSPERAPDEDLDRVYSALLERLSLTTHHRDALVARKLTGKQAAQLRQAGYRSLPSGRPRWRAVREAIESLGEQTRQILLRVPGVIFCPNDRGGYWTTTGKPGLLLPVRNAAGQIVRLLVRPDDPGPEGGKYRWLSASKIHGGARAGKPLPIHVPLFQGDRSTIRVVEGALKADATTLLSGTLTVGLPGLGFKGLRELLQQLGARRVLIAYDADAATNKNVARALAMIVPYLRKADLEIVLERWPLEKAKGIDDLFATGGTPEVIDAPAAIDQAVAEVLESSGARPPGQAGANGADSC